MTIQLISTWYHFWRLAYWVTD